MATRYGGYGYGGYVHDFNNGSVPLPRPVTAPDPASDDEPALDNVESLIVKKLDPCVTENGSLHQTSEYNLMNQGDNSSLVIRRGQPFQIDLHLNRPYRVDVDGISFIFTVIDDRENPKIGVTEVGIPLAEESNTFTPNQWNAVFKNSSGNNIKVQITTPANCIVAKWKCEVDTNILDHMDIRPYTYELKTPIYILFNPWCRDDQVYMKSEIWKKEAVLEDKGQMWLGTPESFCTCMWKYGQFEENILDCSLYIITNIGKLSGLARANPIETARAIGASVKGKVIWGSWGGDYSDGTNPMEWTGSTEILQKYYGKKKQVFYGQCWVFSGVITTICRAIGIPARPISNFNSAHCGSGSLTLDTTLPGEPRGNFTESIWNFHVWNELWMERLDLGVKFGGWQALDANHGPASLVAIKQGDVKRPYDTGYIFSEVNADVIFWKYLGKSQPPKFVSIETDRVGKTISTKEAGGYDRVDITLLYKDEEFSTEERSTMMKALRESRDFYAEYSLKLANEFRDINLEFGRIRDIMIGQPFKATLVINNLSKKNDYTIKVILSAEAIKYTGEVVKLVKRKTFTKVLSKSAKEELKMEVTYDEYRNKIVEHAAFNVSCYAEVENTDYEYFQAYDFRLKKPDLQIDLQDRAFLHNTCKAVVSLKNPLPKTLKKGTLKIEAPGYRGEFKINIPSGAKQSFDFSFTPITTGNLITANLFCNELDYCNGFLSFKAEK